MSLRELGDSGVKVSPISLGCWIFGVDWWGHREQHDCDRMCGLALERGITYFDNGDAYGNGRAETMFGQWLKTLPTSQRDNVQIGGKFGYDWHTDPGVPGGHSERKHDFSPAFVRRALQQSLSRLGVERIDVYLAHNIRLHHITPELFAECEKFVEEGKIGTWGVSLGPAIGWREEGFTAMLDHGAKVCQTVYNVLEQHPGRELGEAAESAGAGLLARVQDHSGILKDAIKQDTKLASSDHRKFRDKSWQIYGPQKADLLRPIAEGHGMTLHQMACKWLLQQPAMTSITATLVSDDEIKEIAAVPDKPDLTTEELNQIHDWYESDFHLGDDAHPCNLKSSVAEDGIERSGYTPPPSLIA
jgi:aryl-alcohol dehydrogenase-like predicted oxidoreductase